jgi:hypothetical protein
MISSIQNIAVSVWKWNDCPVDKDLDIWGCAEKEFNSLNKLTKKTAHLLWLLKKSLCNKIYKQLIGLEEYEIIKNFNISTITRHNAKDVHIQELLLLPNDDLINWESAENLVNKLNVEYVYVVKLIKNYQETYEWVLSNNKYNNISFVTNKKMTDNITYILSTDNIIDTSFNLRDIKYEIVKNLEEYHCKICCKIMNKIKLLNCGHILCNKCLHNLSSTTCPYCRSEINYFLVKEYYVRVPV